VEELVTVHEVGEIVAENIVDFFDTPENKKLIQRLHDHGVNTTAAQSNTSGPKPFADKTFVVTGTLENYTRDSIKDRIKELGGKPTSSVSKKTDYVLIGDSPGSKAAKAEKLGVTILTEEQFEAMAQG
jgi:DNA ligase (NAD+)